MKRKGYNPSEADVPVILAIHNTVNEHGWKSLKEWEHFRGCDSPKLKRFMGRPKDISPKAYFKSFLGYSLPFDRHDWIIESNGTDVRYVIDFYKGSTDKIVSEASENPEKNQHTPVIAMHIDVRPALDSPSAILARLQVFGLRMLGLDPFKKK
jgi:cytochrome c heme-lyase